MTNSYFQEIQICARHDKINNASLFVSETAQLDAVTFVYNSCIEFINLKTS
jgi:hypothetical protein